MHELGLARTIAAAIRENGWQSSPTLVRVRSPHSDFDAFERSLLAHLRAEVPELSEGQVRVVEVPSPRVCSACASRFEGLLGAPCPGCGGPAMPSAADEQVDLELDTAEAPACV